MGTFLDSTISSIKHVDIHFSSIIRMNTFMIVNKQIHILTAMEKYNLLVHVVTYAIRTDFYVLHTLAFLQCVTIVPYHSHDIYKHSCIFFCPVFFFFPTQIFTREQHKLTTMNFLLFASFLALKSFCKEIAPIGITCVFH